MVNNHARSINDEDYKEIASELGVSLKEVVEMDQRMSGPDISLNRTTSHENKDVEVIEFLPERKPNQELFLLQKQDMEKKRLMLAEAMHILNEREAKILTARKLNYLPKTLDSLSVEYKISKERVRQIESRAFEKLRNHILAKFSGERKQLIKNLSG